MTGQESQVVPAEEVFDEAQLDASLILRVQGGDEDAFAMLWRRHAVAARGYASRVTDSYDPDDLVSEAFAKLLPLIRDGKGPTGHFRPYLYVTIRNTAISWARKSREEAARQLEDQPDPRSADNSTFARADAQMMVQAFGTLPPRWQKILWLTEVEGLTPHEAASHLGGSANAVAALAYRAREGLRQAWIQAHVEVADAALEHRWTLERVGRAVAGSLSARDTKRFDEHMSHCSECFDSMVSAKIISANFTPALYPLSLGVLAALGLGGLLSVVEPVSANAVDKRYARRRGSQVILTRRRTAILVSAVGFILLVGLSATANLTEQFMDLEQLAPGRVEAGREPDKSQSTISPVPIPTPSLPELPTPHSVNTSPPSSEPQPDAPTTPSPAQESTVFDGGLVVTSIDSNDGLLYPVLSGTARAETVVTIKVGTVSETVISGSDGRWQSPQFVIGPGIYDAHVTADANSVIKTGIVVTAPVVSLSTQAVGTTVIVRGQPISDYIVSTGFETRSIKTSADGAATVFIPASGENGLPSQAGLAVSVRATNGDRIGPSVTMRTS